MRELIFDDVEVVRKEPRKRSAPTKRRDRAIGHIIATENKTLRKFKLPYYNGQNSFGEPGAFIGRPKLARFRDLNGYPLYAMQQWLVSNGYRYEVT